MSNTFDKLSVLDSFIEEVESYLPEIEAHLERLVQSPKDTRALEEIHRRAHTIGGSASMMDFPGLAHVAHGMEDILVDALEDVVVLDEPTLALLQRSLGRIYMLLKGIRKGSEEDAIIANDDEDYARYQARLETSAQPESNEHADKAQEFDMAVPGAFADSAMPSLDEVLASFHTPVASSVEDIARPEEPLSPPLAGHVEHSTQADATEEHTSAEYVQPLPANPSLETESALIENQGLPVASQSDEETTRGNSLPVAYQDARRDAQALDVQIASLKTMGAQLRSAMSVIDAQRREFKGFLDGSKDALDRLEGWAGQAMGLNLRNSPEQVRRYLPLSVMWVANSKLKKVLDLLNQVTNGVEVTDEQFHETLQQLHLSLAAYGNSFKQLQADSTRVFVEEPGWTPWEMRMTRNEDAVRERVTFERRGDIASLREELEANLREEVRREYESRPISTAARAELEQQIRNEVRQEFEAKRHMQERFSSASESRQEVEARLRSEIEILVRQEFLNQITNSGSLASALQATAPSSSNFVDRAATELTRRTTTSHTELATYVKSIDTSTSGSSMRTQPTQPLPALAPTPTTSSSSASSNDFAEEAAEIFRLEAEEHLQTISMHVAALEKAPTNRELIQGIRRATHTLKGAAGMMGFRAIADLCHVSEDLFDSIMEDSTHISPAVLSIILDTAETLDMLITGQGTSQGSAEARVEALRARYIELLGEQSAAPGAIEDEDIDIGEGPITQPTLAANVIGEGQPIEASQRSEGSGDLSVRVRLQKLDELVNLFGELLVNRSVLEERLSRVTRLVADVALSSTRLRDVGQKLESRFEAATLPSGRSVQVMPGEGNQIHGARNGKNNAAPSHLTEFDELELDRYTEFHQLARGLSEGISDMTTLSSEMDAVIRECEGVFARENRLSTTFQDRLVKVRLVPLATITPRLYRAARAVAFKQHKEFEFLLEGAETEVDRTVFEEIAGPLLHLMRNAVNHAIEAPDVRMQKGKPPAGKITLMASYEGNLVVITVRDDGTGIDPGRIRDSAIARGLIQPDQVLSESDVIELIFRPGFSTAEVLSEESGRGVGLDVVRDSVARLRGTLVVDSTPGQGTSFTMKFPTSLAIQSVMMVRVAGEQYAIPTAVVEAVGRLDNFKRSTLAGQPAVVVQNDLYSLTVMAQYLSLPIGLLDDKSPLLLVNAGGRRIALVVDEVKSKSDVVMKNLGPHLRHVHGIAGGTVLGNGRVVLVLELTELLKIHPHIFSNMAGSTTAALASIHAESLATQVSQVSMGQRSGVSAEKQSTGVKSPVAERRKHILVVDDSPSVRRVVSNMLKQHGWEAQIARDGVEALEMISRETPVAVLLDIEMPRMDGYELISTIRAQEQYRTLPIIMLTSRAASKHQQRALQLGANSYVVKPYQDEELIKTINALVYDAVVH